ncbi:MAG: hypothetical protein HOI29_01455 [Planctomycetes bacterium]|nr:hypothetical protein [Planctomycetota bacterium]MBT7104730.1 hypothetical protein [Planctomycetota bacterium]
MVPISSAMSTVEMEPISLASLTSEVAIPAPLYLRIDCDSVLCRKTGESLDGDLRRQLFEAGQDLVWIRRSDRHFYHQYLRSEVLKRYHGVEGTGPIESFSTTTLESLPQWMEAVEAVQIDRPEAYGRSWRIAHYGIQLATGLGVATESFLRPLICGLLLHEVSQVDGQDLNLLKLEENAVSIIDGWRERIDGNGALGWNSKRLTIPLRIAAVAIAFDHRTSGDGGRPRQPAFDVLREFIISEHGALDPTIIAAFIRILDH